MLSKDEAKESLSKKYADYKRQIKNRRTGKDHVHNVMVMLAKMPPQSMVSRIIGKSTCQRNWYEV